MTTERGWAAEYLDKNGYNWDVGAGWPDYESARSIITSEINLPLQNIRIYYAQTMDDWETWIEIDSWERPVPNKLVHRAENIGTP